jgi:hypothetical protein
MTTHPHLHLADEMDAAIAVVQMVLGAKVIETEQPDEGETDE